MLLQLRANQNMKHQNNYHKIPSHFFHFIVFTIYQISIPKQTDLPEALYVFCSISPYSHQPCGMFNIRCIRGRQSQQGNTKKTTPRMECALPKPSSLVPCLQTCRAASTDRDRDRTYGLCFSQERWGGVPPSCPIPSF